MLHSIPLSVLTGITLIAWRWLVAGGILLLGCTAVLAVFIRVQSGADFTPWQFVNPVFILPVILGILLIITPAVERRLRHRNTPST